MVGQAREGEMIPAYTSEQSRLHVERGMARYPKDPSKYRRVNHAMDKELVHYKKEIESRFKKSDMRLY